MSRERRARVLLEEARTLHIDLDDLVAAATGESRPVTVTEWIDEIAPAFGPSTARTCALRAIYARAVDAGHLTTNPAAALRKPRRTNTRRRALDRELADLADAIRATRRDPTTSTCCWSGSTSRPAPASRAPFTAAAGHQPDPGHGLAPREARQRP